MKTSRTKIGSPAWNQAKAEGRAVYCGRACHRSTEPLAHIKSPYHNPFPASLHADPVGTFRFFWHQPINAEVRERARRELKGKVLGCFCKESEPCHCDVIIEDIERDGE